MSAMDQATKDHLADVRRNGRDELHDARLADGLAKLAALLQRDRNRTERLRCSWFIRRYGAAWREVMEQRRGGNRLAESINTPRATDSTVAASPPLPFSA